MSVPGAGQPIIILREGTERSQGRDARSNNLLAAKIVAQAIKTSLGPKGMDIKKLGPFPDSQTFQRGEDRMGPTLCRAP